nr:PREDICTED: transmembrane protein 150A-like [Paralichthys olivaceus]
MSLWIILPVSLPVFTITGIWLVYTMALYNQHVCPVHNWLYNESCEEPLVLQRDPVLCCTLDNIPLISKCGTLPPESCFFSLICSTGSFMAMLIGLLRYAHVIERHQNCVLNMAGLSTGWICAAGLIMVGNFQMMMIYGSSPWQLETEGLSGGSVELKEKICSAATCA